MTTTTFPQARALGGSRLMILDAFNAAFAAWSRRKTQMMIANLDDHILRDIGLDPSNVRRPSTATRDWVIDSRKGLVFIGH
jgi:hypothetical protein